MTDKKNVVLNLTTTSGRLDLCSATLWSLVNQSLPAQTINLWVSTESYMADKGICSFPESINNLIKYNDLIKIKYVENTGPYRKIIPALREYSDDDILVYADDDVIYSHRWLETLITSYLENDGKYVVSSRVREMKKNLFDHYQSYSLFPLTYEKKVFDRDFIITGVGGCVLAKKHIAQKYIDMEVYKKVAPKTDDLWISKIIELSGSKVLTCPNALDCVMEIQHDINALNRVNTFLTNDSTISRLMAYVKKRTLGYLGVRLSSNDDMIRNINYYFKHEERV